MGAAVDREYEYRPTWVVVTLCAVAFTLAAVVLGVNAAANDRGLIVGRLAELSPDEATRLYWFLCGASVVLAVLTALLAYHRVAFRQRIAFSPTGLLVPASWWSSAEKEIPYRDIQTLSTARVRGGWFLIVTHPGGRFTLTAAQLPSQAAFDEICDLLGARIQAT